MRRMIILHRQPDLPQLVLANRSAGGFADRLDSREQHPDQDADNGNHDQQLDEREGAAMAHGQTMLFWRF